MRCIQEAGRTVFIALFLIFASLIRAQTSSGTGTAASSAELRMEQKLDAMRNDPLALHAFLLRMPKGADLHMHLSGAVYAESFIRAAAEDNLCVDPVSNSFAKPLSMSDGVPPQPVCGEGKVAATLVFKNQHLYDALVDSFSMRGFVPSPGVTGHDHFFDTFGKFSGTSPNHLGEWVDEVVTRAAAQNEQYLELMITPASSRVWNISKDVPWSDDFKKLRDDLLAHGLRDDIAMARASLDQMEATRRHLEHCGEAGETPACKVQPRYICQVSRGSAKELVFAQTLLWFELASADPRFAGLNYVQAEDGYTSMADYALHMRMVGFLHGLYPSVHISLHAGELAFGLVPPAGLCCHIRQAVEQAHAERIGHGVDVMYEDRPYDLLKEMAKSHVLVEINLTSNDVILGITGKEHPLQTYRKYGVPVALSTDDEGVSRIDLTHEYLRAVQSYGFTYRDLKQMARATLEHSFLPGESLWHERDAFSKLATACAKDMPGSERPSPACGSFLKSSEKARQQWELERRFRVFETGN
jgi:adenosine deaminase